MKKDRELSRQQKGLLKILKDFNDSVSTSDLWNDERVSTYYSNQGNVTRALRTLEEKPFKFVKCQKGKRNANLWLLSEKGERKVRKIQKQKKGSKKEDDKFFEHSNAVEVFEQYFEDPGEEQFNNAKSGRRYIYLDYEKLDRFDVELADELLKQPEKVISACKEVVTSNPDVKDNIDVRVRNIPETDTKEISELSAEEIGELVTIDGVLQSSSGVGAELVSAMFECNQCGQRYEKKQDGTKLKSPYKCEDCGCRKFECTEKNHKTVRVVNIKEKPGKRNRDNIVTKLVGKLAEDESKNLGATGSGIKVTGYLDSIKRKRNADQLELQLIANNIEVEEQKWDQIDIDPEDEEKIWEISNRDDVKDHLVRSFAAEEIKHQDLAKEGFITWLLGRTDEGNLHVLLIGEPGTGKTHLGKYANENLPRIIRAVGAGATGIGLTAAVRKDELTGDWVAEAGSLAMADDGFHITDEIDKVPVEDLSKMNDALSDEVITLDKGTIHADISADVAEFSIGNPQNANFDDHEEKYKQIPIPDDKADLKDRYDLMIGLERSTIESKEERRKEEEKVDMILRRDQDQLEKGSADVMGKELFVKYIAYAQRIDPSFSEDALNKIKDLYFRIKDAESGGENLWDLRRVTSLKKLSVAYSRLFLSEEVEERHVQLAASFIRRCFESMDFQVGKDDLDSVSYSDTNRINEVKDKLSELDDGSPVEIQRLVENVSMSESNAEKVIEKLLSDGELFEPEQGCVKKM